MRGPREDPLDLIFVPGFVSNIELAWESPGQARQFSRLAAFSRLIVFDKRGTGLSDRDVGIAHLEERMDDVRAVMDAVGSESVEDHDGIATAGDYVWRKSGSLHDNESPGGAVLFAVYRKPNIYYHTAKETPRLLAEERREPD